MTKKKTTWSNLTKAIRKNKPIDWWALDGRRGSVTSKHDRHWTALTFFFYRDTNYEEGTMEGMTESNIPPVFGRLVALAWRGEEDLRLWVEGEIPLLPEPEPVTADTLPVGACFMDSDGIPGMVFEARNSYLKVAFPHEGTIRPAGEIKVQQVFGVGTFKPDGETDV